VAILDPTPSARPFRVLIVDDSASFRRVARDVLEYRGYRVAGEAESARAAIAAVTALSPDAALIDVGLPDASGTDLAGYLLTHHPGVAVLLCSADPECNLRSQTNLFGAAGFVVKSELAQVDLRAFWPLPAP
jgi:DNA-binding NarL/FixJ family response regulator